MNKTFINTLLSVVGFIAAFLLIQIVAMTIAGKDANSLAITIAVAASGIVTILLFALCQWSPFSRTYLRSKPWLSLLWVALMTFGTVIPSIWLLEILGTDMPEKAMQTMERILSQPEGYLAIGIVAPLAEEMVFRGAVLQSLLQLVNHQRLPLHRKRVAIWCAIAVSSLLFGAVHGNIPQFIHATLIGLLLGWMYYRTDSIVPGVVFHWVNNTIAFVTYNLMPQSADAKLIDIFGGNERAVWLALVFSLLIFLPSLFQVATRLHKSNKVTKQII